MRPAVLGERWAAHLLRRAGFGGTETEIRRFAKLSPEAAVERLLAPKPSRARGPGRSEKDTAQLRALQRWWIRRMHKGRYRLHEKVALFWHDHFVSGYSVVKNVRQMALQNQLFREHGLGSFRELVYRVTKDAAMLDYLDGRRNTKNRPNENYARELMELFTLGIVDRDGNPNYTQQDVVELARALTGYVVVDDEGVFDPSRHDSGTKTLFAGKPFEATGPLGIEDGAGGQLPPEHNVIDILLAHRDTRGRPTAALFIAAKLWAWFAYPDPDDALVEELGSAFHASGYEIATLVRAILLHDEFYTDRARTSTVKMPIEFALEAIRALRVRTSFWTLSGREPTQKRSRIGSAMDAMGMELFDPPTVNGWNHGLPWLATGQHLARFELAAAIAFGDDPATFRLVPKRVVRDPSGPEAIVDAVLAKLDLADRVAPTTRDALVAYAADGLDLADPASVERKIRGTVYLALTLPEFELH